MSRKAWLVGLVAVAVAVLPAVASGSMRLGPDLTSPPVVSGGFGFVAVGCQESIPSCSFVNVQSTNPDALATTPAPGVITSWSFRAGMFPQLDATTMTLKTFRPGNQVPGYPSIVPMNTGPSFEIPAGNQLSSGATVLPARTPIAAGEGVLILADNAISFAVYSPTPNVTSVVLSTGFAPYLGEYYGYTIPDTAIAVSAVVEPDADGDGYGDETQDCFPTDPTRFQGNCGPPPVPIPTPLPIVDPGGKCQVACGGGVVFSPPPSSPPSGDGSRFYVALKCPENATAPCGGFLIVEQAKPGKPRVVDPVAPRPPAAAVFKQLARKGYEVAPGTTEKLKLRLSKAGRKLLRRKGKLKVTVTIEPNAGEPISTSRTLKAG